MKAYKETESGKTYVVKEENVRKYYKYKSPAEGYRELNYVSGVNPLDTEFYPTSNTKVQSKLIYSGSGGGSFIGKQNTEDDAFRFFRADNLTYLDYGSGANKNRISGSFITSSTSIYEVEFGNRYVKNLATDTIIFSGTSVSFATKTYTINVFDGIYDYGTIFYLKIFDGDTLVRNFIPCERLSDNKFGLYDKQNDAFYEGDNWNSDSGYIIEEATAEDYDFYEDVDVYKAIKSYEKGQYYGN